MRKTLMLLVASTMLTATLGVSAWSAIKPSDAAAPRAIANLVHTTRDAAPLTLVSGNHDDDDKRGHARRDDDGQHRGQDHVDADEDEDEDDNDDDHGGGKGAARNAARSGTVAPPANGLFGNGAPPRVQMH